MLASSSSSSASAAAAAAARRPGKGKMRPPRKLGPESSSSAIDDTWLKLAHAIKEIQHHNASQLSFEEHYRYAYNMVLYKAGDKLYDGVRRLIEENLEQLAEGEIVPTFPRTTTTTSGDGGAGAEMSLEGTRFLRALAQVWDDHRSSMTKLRSILKYMDKVYTTPASRPSVMDLGDRLFVSRILHSPSFPIASTLRSVLLTQMHLHRLGESVDAQAIKAVITIVAGLGCVGWGEGGKASTTKASSGGDRSVYTSDLEEAILDASDRFYRDEAETTQRQGDASAYLRQVQRRLADEDAFAKNYLLPVTAPQLVAILERNLLANQLATILEMPGTGLVAMVEDDRAADLRRVYDLFSRAGVMPEGMDVLRRQLGATIKGRGAALNAAEVEAPQAAGAGGGAATVALKWVQDVLDLKDKFDRILEQGFAGDKSVQTAINSAFQDFVNLHPKAQEYVSLFIDDNLKKGLKGKTSDEVEAVLEKTIVLFRFINDKDVFERYYKVHLAKRLLAGRSVSEEAEKAMVSKLKVESGSQFTQKLEGMFVDMRLSSEIQRGFERHLAKGDPLGYELGVTVLTATYWPGDARSSSCAFPPQLQRGLSSFERFYATRHTGRRLTWHPNHGTADVRVQFAARKHELNVSTLCLVILLLFQDLDDGAELSWHEIREATQMSDVDLVRSLQSLACAKFRVLTKNPKSRDVATTDRFSFNSAFTCPLAKIKIQTVAGKVENPEERKETQERVEEERKYQIEAAIVRTMKGRKEMTHVDLVNEVARQLMSRFKTSPATIKKRIEGLIDREFLERDGLDAYKYLA